METGVQNGKTMAMPPPGQMERQCNREMGQQGMKGKQGGGKANEGKAQEMSNDIFFGLSVSFFFLSHFIILLLMNFLGIK